MMIAKVKFITPKNREWFRSDIGYRYILLFGVICIFVGLVVGVSLTNQPTPTATHKVSRLF